MLKKSLAVFGVLIVTACGPTTTGGGGQLSDGKPVSGVLTGDVVRNEFSAKIISPKGWSCTSSTGKPHDDGGSSLTVPMHCTNSVTGTIVLTGNRAQKQIVGAFHLSSGKTGQVTFGRL